ncbi:MAG TPA: L-threonylcarbamoyladenylate synthase [Ktedonobacteraceae bacterium]|nr:L-threonylcarbamoyladenylate synthase [Ktedonobacteraceae bacterium]
MHTEVVKIDPVHPEPSIIEHAVKVLRSGEVVVFPTETVYGLGADAFQPAALERIFAAKGRPFSDPLIVHIAEEKSLELVTTSIPERARQLAEVFWPGPLTLILPRGPRVPRLVTAGLDTVAVRMPRHPVALALIRATGSPIAAPSANRFMHVSPTTAQHALADLDGRVPLILDSGPCEVGVESTVLDLCSEVPRILRPGGVSLEALRGVLPDIQPPVRRTVKAKGEEEAQIAPGQLLTHYAPAVPLLLFDGSLEAMRHAMLDELRHRHAVGESVGILIADEDGAAFEGSGAVIQMLGSADHPKQIATALFAGLRALETAGVNVILCRNFDEYGLGLAIRDRLLKAAGGKITKLD